MILSKKITVEGKSYEITFPQTGREQVGIMTKQSDFSEGKYLEILSLNTQAGFFQWQLINTSALLDTIAPLIAKDMNGGKDISVMDLPIKKAKILVDIYVKEIEDWYADCEKEAFEE